jgi:lysophospholipase L1-like esterase
MCRDISIPRTSGIFILLASLLISCSSPAPESYIILCAGDSLTEAGYPLHLARILKEEGIRAKVLNFGKSGRTSGEYLRFLQEKKEEMAESLPDFVLIQLGTNDVRTDHDRTSAEAFFGNMNKIIRHFSGFKNRREKTPQILLATIPPIPEGTPFPFSSESVKRVTEEINPLIQNIAAENNIILVDNYSTFVDNPYLLPEVHPSDEGYRAMAVNWHLALKKFGLKPSGKT